MDISQFKVGVMPETHFILDNSCVLAMRDYEDAHSVPLGVLVSMVHETSHACGIPHTRTRG